MAEKKISVVLELQLSKHELESLYRILHVGVVQYTKDMEDEIKYKEIRKLVNNIQESLGKYGQKFQV